MLVSRLKSLRKESEFYEKCLGISQDLTEEPQLPQYKKMPRRLDEGATQHCFLVPKGRYFEALEQATGEVENVLINLSYKEH